MNRAIATLAQAQHGVVAAHQVLGSRRSLRRAALRGATVELHPGVFRIGGAPDTWAQRVLAACLASGGLASHRSAARLWQFDGCADDTVEILVPHGWGRSLAGVEAHEFRGLLTDDPRVADAIPVTAPELTLLQLGAVQPRRVEHALDSALRMGLTTVPRLTWRLQVLGRRGRNGTATLRALVEARDPDLAVPESVLERKFLRLIAELPTPMLQHEVELGDRIVRVDFAWTEQRLIVELDGARYHSGQARVHADLRRQRDLTALGWKVLPFTWSDVVDTPTTTIATLRTVLAGHPPGFASSHQPRREGEGSNGPGGGDPGWASIAS